ncbi:MAG TPA: hemerythrin domain-containing protein [Actinobacteria bacterium]|nr:hemerythrin domain-containing protein [Actinomycetota bacterium]
MAEIADFMTAEHRRCDELFAEAEAAVAAADWEAAEERFEEFADLTLRHLEREERVLFPEFEARTGMSDGPTVVMRREHDQMRALLASMREALARRDDDGFLGDAETFMILTQQHDMKEEQVLYPMSDEALGAEAPTVLGRMREL